MSTETTSYRVQLKELEALQKENKNYTFVPTMTGDLHPDRPWSGETGQINQEMLAEYLGGARSPIYYLVGLPGMVRGLEKMLNASRIDDDDIRTEGFSGY